MLLRALLFLFVLFGVTGRADANIEDSYYPFVYDDEYPDFLALVDDIDGRTALIFERAIEQFGAPHTLILSSNGGSVTEALLIARRINSLGINTYIPANAGCYSACAMIFLGGVVRIADGELGVHQVSSSTGDLESGQISISDILETLNKFDVPNDLLVNMFRTPPDQMYVLSPEEKIKYAFVTGAQRDVEMPAESDAVRFVVEYNLAWSSNNSVAILKIADMYADRVKFYGKEIALADLLEEKVAFAKRWPDRVYNVLGETVSASCDPDYCYVRGNVAWDARSIPRNAKSLGLAYFDLVLARMGPGFRIVSEDGRVLERY